MDEQLQTATSATAAPSDPFDASSGYEALREEAKTGKTIEFRDRVWHLRDEIGDMNMLDLALIGDEQSTDVERARALRDFLEVALVPEEAVEFNRMLRRAEPAIKLDELGKLVEQLVEKFSGRPT